LLLPLFATNEITENNSNDDPSNQQQQQQQQPMISMTRREEEDDNNSTTHEQLVVNNQSNDMQNNDDDDDDDDVTFLQRELKHIQSLEAILRELEEYQYELHDNDNEEIDNIDHFWDEDSINEY
jgi:hypothetical protein